MAAKQKRHSMAEALKERKDVKALARRLEKKIAEP